MAYLNNTTRLSSLTIGGVNYTSNLVSFSVSDASANKNGLISTVGTLSLKAYGDNPPMEDYDRDNFKRGVQVIVDITTPEGGVVRHPRGWLYVLGVGYNPDDDSLEVEIGCRLALAALTEDVSQLLPLAPVPLDPAQQTYQNISASFSAAGKYLFQKNDGSLVSGYFFENDYSSSIGAGEWVSVFGTTALSVEPLAGTSPIPDEINLTYQVPSAGLVSDQTGRVDLETNESKYFLSYPAIIFKRVKQAPPNLPSPPKPPAPKPIPPPRPSGCGNAPVIPPSNSPTPTPVGQGEKVSCSDQYETVQQQTFVSATKIDTRRTEYKAIGGQVSTVFSETYGPAIEVNGQYYADHYAFCRYTYANQCMPNGSCPLEGLNNVLQSRSRQTNYYSFTGELVKTVTDNYEPRLAGAQPSDWRSGVTNGVPEGLRYISASQIYRVSRQVTEYKYGKNRNEQLTTNWVSSTSRGSGIGGAIDAMAGIKTTQKRISTTISVTPVSPDRANTVSTSTTEKSQRIVLSPRYVQPPTESGPYIVKEQMPVPVLFESQSLISSTVNTYANYLTKFIKGDAYGLSIAESLRSEIITNWRPGMPFRYYDPRKGKLLAMRMDGCVWGIDPNQSLVGFNGIWIGTSNGTVSLPTNLSGDSRPDMGSGGAPPVGPTTPPAVGGETVVDIGSFNFEVNVDIMTAVTKSFWGQTGVHPILPGVDGRTFNMQPVFTVWCTGYITTAGSLINTTFGGSIPLSANGSLLTVNAAIIDDDLFAL